MPVPSPNQLRTCKRMLDLFCPWNMNEHVLQHEEEASPNLEALLFR